MAQDTHLTLVGNLAADPELRYTQGGDAVVNFRVGSTPSRFDRQRNEWVDEETIWMDCVAWRGKAEGIADSFHKGARVIVTGKVRTVSWEPSDGSPRRTKLELDVAEAGIAVRSTAAGGGGRAPAPAARPAQQQPADPWGAGAPAPAQAAPAAATSEPPF